MTPGAFGYRNPRGTSNEEFWKWRSNDKTGPFAVEETIQQTISKNTLSVFKQFLEKYHVVGDNPLDVDRICTCPDNEDADIWQYEQLRQIVMELNVLTSYLQFVCSKTSCPIMKATDEWVFLCAAHKSPQECCALEYIIHTLDGTYALLNSTKAFPSRVCIPPESVPYFQSIARRLYRIFSHTYFHHRETFNMFEKETHLCLRFHYFVKKFNLIPQDLLIVPQLGLTMQ